MPTKIFSYFTFTAILLALIPILSSCGLSSRPYPLVRTFSLEIPSVGDSPEISLKKPLATVLVTSSPPPAAYESKKVVYKLSATEFSQDYYSEFQTPPARAIADGFSKYLDFSNERYNFVRTQGVKPPEYVLEIRLTDFYGDLSQGPLTADIALSITLNDLRPANPKLLFVRNYVKRIPVREDLSESDRVTGLIGAFVQGLGEIATELDGELLKYLGLGRR
jgi:ABC-type uncharacterized transport system auxiliary subunit